MRGVGSGGGGGGDSRGSCCRAGRRRAAAPCSSERERSDRPGAAPCFLPGNRRAAFLFTPRRRRIQSAPRDHVIGKKRWKADLVLGVRVGAGLHQRLHRLAEAVPGDLVERRVAVLTETKSFKVVRSSSAVRVLLILIKQHKQPNK